MAVGAPSFDPDGPALVRMLRAGGIEPVRIEQIRSIGGLLAYRRRDLPTLVLRLRTPHDRSADLLERLWRRVRYRRPTGDGPMGSMKRRIEREALAATVARAAACGCRPSRAWWPTRRARWAWPWRTRPDGRSARWATT